MRHVRLRIGPVGDGGELPAVYRVLSSAPYLDRVVGLHWNFSGDRIGMLLRMEGDIDAFRGEIRRIPDVIEFEVTPSGDGRFYAYLQDEVGETSRRLFETFTRSGLLVGPPLVYGGDGSTTLSVVGPIDEIRSAVAAVPAPFEVSIHEVSGMGATPGLARTLLSERQREAIETAVDVGYYDVPREGSHEAIATRMGCASSTAAEHLRKAESKILRTMFARD